MCLGGRAGGVDDGKRICRTLLVYNIYEEMMYVLSIDMMVSSVDDGAVAGGEQPIYKELFRGIKGLI